MIHYLTVQDVLWVNHQVTKRVNEFKFAQLEEAVNYQYGYGSSEDIVEQAGVFLEGFIRLRPFTEGNRATAFVSALSFLAINEYDITLSPDDALNWAMSVAQKKSGGVEAMVAVAAPSARPLSIRPHVRTKVHEVMEVYADAIAELQD
jgi:prophage maintenance system killer protein